MEIIKCNLCAGSSDIELYKIQTKDKLIHTDICIGKEIEYLINQSIKTYGCCCGHGDMKPSCLVDIQSKNKLDELGYTLHDFSKEHSQNGIYKIYLKTNIQCELRKVINNKVWRYLKENDKKNDSIIKTNRLGLPIISGKGKTMREMFNEDYR